MKCTVFEGDQRQCYGCRACEQICPQGCIDMTPDGEGFAYPVIRSLDCTGCGLCQRVCPAIADHLRPIRNDVARMVFAAWNKDAEQRMASASGGIFPLFAEFVLEQHGSVYGCALDNDLSGARQIRVISKEDLHKLKGSKYVQSSTDESYSRVKKDLEDGQFVLYSGTPCQIAGLKLFLRKDYEKLLTVDLVCHGTPSPKMLAAYVEYLEGREGARITNLKFRDKKWMGWRPWVSWKIGNKKKFRLYGTEPYAYGFLRGYLNRESCYQCHFCCPERVGDITLADYWGVERFHPDLYKEHRHGISLVLCNSTKGVEAFSAVKGKMHHVESMMECAMAGNGNLCSVRSRPALRDVVYRELDEKGFKFLAQTFFRPKRVWLRRWIPSVVVVGAKILKGVFR